MSTDRIGLNPWIEGEIHHRSVANVLQTFQSVTIPFTFGSDKNLRIGLNQIYGWTDFLCTYFAISSSLIGWQWIWRRERSHENPLLAVS